MHGHSTAALGETRPATNPAPLKRGPGRPAKPLVPVRWAPRPPVLGECAAPDWTHDLLARDRTRRIWIIDPDLYLVERDEGSDTAQPICVCVLWGLDQVIRCTCAAGLRGIGCDHVLAVGERLAVPPVRRVMPASSGGKARRT